MKSDIPVTFVIKIVRFSVLRKVYPSYCENLLLWLEAGGNTEVNGSSLRGFSGYCSVSLLANCPVKQREKLPVRNTPWYDYLFLVRGFLRRIRSYPVNSKTHNVYILCMRVMCTFHKMHNSMYDYAKYDRGLRILSHQDYWVLTAGHSKKYDNFSMAK